MNKLAFENWKGDNQVAGSMEKRGLTSGEMDMVEINFQKEVRFTNCFGEVVEGYINGGEIHNGWFVYHISAAKNPRIKFSLGGGGTWFMVAPQYIIL